MLKDKTAVKVKRSDRWTGGTDSFLAAAEPTVCLVMTVRTWSAPGPCSDPQTAHVVFPELMNPSASGWHCAAR